MEALAWWKEFADVLRAWWLLIVAIATVLAPLVWRFCVRPARQFITRLDDSMKKVDVMSKALGPNGGSSLADQIGLTARASVMNAARMAAVMDHIERPLFETDLQGGYTRTNRAMEDLLGYSNEDLKGRGWISAVADEDRDRTVREWFHAVADRRACVIRTRLRPRRGSIIHAHIQAQPMDHELTGDVVAWMGSISVISAEAM